MQQNSKVLRYFLYLRKSTQRDDMQVLSIEGQREACLIFAQQNELVIVDTIVERQSAMVPGRPLFDEMLSRIQAGEADGIIAYHPNRLARNSKDGGEIIYFLDTGILRDMKFPTFWFENSSQGKFMLGLEFVQSKKYSDDLSFHSRRGQLQKCELGIRPGKAPRGYLNDRKAKLIVVDPFLGPVIREMFELYASGSMTIEALSAHLADRGVISCRNKRDPGGKLLHSDQIRNMLQNPVYYGSFRYAGKIYDGKHPPLISKSLFDRVQEISAMKSHSIPRQRVAKPYLRLIRCNECGMAITAESHKGNTYYRCTRKSKTESCNAPFIREEQLEAHLIEALVSHELPKEIADDFLQRIDAETASLTETTARSLFEARSAVKQIAGELDRLLEIYLSQTIDRSEYVLQQNKLHSKKSSLIEEITRLEGASTIWLERFKKWVTTAQQLGSLAKSGSPTERRRLASEVFGSNLRLSGKKLSGEAVTPWFSQPKTGSLPCIVDIYSSARQHFVGFRSAPTIRRR